MATKKTRKKPTKSKKRIKSKRAASAPAKKGLGKKKPALKKSKAKTKLVTKAKVVSKNKKKASSQKSGRPAARRVARPISRRSDRAFGTASDSDSAGQSGDLQGLSNVESADSESVDELIDEGNAFEAGVISGVEEADDQDGREVHTHEVPEDDVPGEYLDEE